MKIKLVILFMATFSHNIYASNVDRVIEEGAERLVENQQSQISIDQVSTQTQDLVAQYYDKLKIVDGLILYNTLLDKQLQNQNNEMDTLMRSISDATVIERQILPLLSRMVDGLDAFVHTDIPFLLEEREQRINKLRGIIVQSSISNAEKARRVFEAFQIENDYGSTIESYKGKVDLGGASYDVDFIRIGRVSYMYRAIGSQAYGYWDADDKRWMPLTSRRLIRNADKAIKIARQEMAPELITVPVKVGGQSSNEK